MCVCVCVCVGVFGTKSAGYKMDDSDVVQVCVRGWVDVCVCVCVCVFVLAQVA